ncbi:unnamed protein product [Nyctereutes procyonoides]|uniref:(raccoon dog) hypothetical protein n=1 Tax=Nyctereutes procyonoides TaxID=34880 RepID=A0A811YRE9_NYCPR|nr:unnamed protein product [Nyctereutes procyonoides]
MQKNNTFDSMFISVKNNSSRILYPRPKSLLTKMMNANMDAVDAENQVELEERDDLLIKLGAVKEENQKLKLENQVLGQYVEKPHVSF